jgi:mRNA-decapping enzyme subunit 2
MSIYHIKYIYKIYTQYMTTLDDCLDDLAVRFLLHLPAADTHSFSRLGFHIEQAYWFYKDIYHQRDPAHCPALTMRTFTHRLMERCRLHGHLPPVMSGQDLSLDTVDQHLSQFSEYKSTVPVCGVALVSETGEKVLMVRGVAARSRWGFPKGKINKDEAPWQCARRECLEECGYSISDSIVEPPHVDALLDGKPVRVYVVLGVSEASKFAPRTRNEIGAIAWHYFDDLPTKKQHEHARWYHNVIPFVRRIRSIVAAGLGSTSSGFGSTAGISTSGAGITSSATTTSSTSSTNLDTGSTSTKRVSVSELMRRAVSPKAPPPTPQPHPDDTSLIIYSDEHDSDSASDLEPDEFLVNVTPVWSGMATADTMSLLALLRGGAGTGASSTGTTGAVHVGRTECVERVSRAIPAHGLAPATLDAVLDLISGD